jgi:hypothetical protein
MVARNNYPVEFYGRYISQATNDDFVSSFQSQTCPFTNKRCVKQRKSDPIQTIGACSVKYQGSSLIICPHRFIQHNQIFLDSIRLLEPGLRYFVVPEVSMPAGSIDYFLIARRGEEIVDYAGIEIQALDTTGSGTIWQAREDLLQGQLAHSYNYGINWKMSAKTILVQLLHKASSFEALKKKLVLIMQKQFFEYLMREFQTDQLRLAKHNDSVHFHIYDVVLNESELQLSLYERLSTDVKGVERMLNFGRSSDILEQDIIERIKSKMLVARPIEISL